MAKDKPTPRAGDRVTPDVASSKEFDRAALADQLKAIDLKLEDDLDNPGGLVIVPVAI